MLTCLRCFDVEMEPDIVPVCIDVILEKQIVNSIPPIFKGTMQIAALEIRREQKSMMREIGRNAFMESSKLIVAYPFGDIANDDCMKTNVLVVSRLIIKFS